MAKYKLVRRQINEFMRINGKGNIYDIEDFIMERNKNCPDRKSILGILNKDSNYVTVDIQPANSGNGRKTKIKVWKLKEG